MRFYTIALFLFAFNLIIGIFNSTGEYTNIQGYSGWDETVANSKDTDYLGSSAAEISTGQEFGDVIKMGGLLIDTLSAALFAPGHYLNEFGVPSIITSMFTLMVWIVYVVGLVQFFSNRSTKAND